MILLNPVNQVGTLLNANGLQITPCSILEPVRGITGQNRFAVRLTVINDDALGTAMPLERLAQKSLGSSEVTPLAEPELNRFAIAVDRAVEVAPLTTDLDVGFVDMPSPGDGLLA